MKVLCLLDGPVRPPDRWIWNHLNGEAQNDQVDFMYAQPSDRFPRWGKLLAYYPAFFLLAAQAWRRSRQVQYDVIVAWEAKAGFPAAVLKTAFGIQRPRLLTLAFAYKGIATRFLSGGRWAMRGMDHLTVPTTAEVAYYRQLLGLRADQVSLLPLGGWEATVDEAPEEAARSGGATDYIFAGGRTERDYGTLFEAVAGLPISVIVNARAFNVRGLRPPANMKLNGFMSLPDYHRIMGRARIVVVPLIETPHAAGLTHILQAMSLGKALVITRSGGVQDYIEDARSGLLVTPHDPAAMRAAIKTLLDNPDQARELGQRARQDFAARFTAQAHAQRCYAAISRVARGL